VIAYGAGGMTEIVRDGLNGMFFAEQHENDLIAAVERFEVNQWPPSRVSEGVKRYSREAFKTRIRQIIDNQLPEISRGCTTSQPA